MERVASFVRSSLPLGFVRKTNIAWTDHVSRFLRLGCTAQDEKLGPVAAHGLRSAIGELSEAAKREHLTQIGLVAKAAALITFVHTHPEHNPVISMRAATTVFDRLRATDVSGQQSYSLAASVGMWLLASMDLNYRQRRAVEQFPLTREAKREAAGMNRWTAGLLSEREKDITALMQGNASLQTFASRVTQLMKTSPAQMEKLNTLASEVDPEFEKCVCFDPIKLVELLWSGATGAAWRVFPSSSSEAVLIQELVAASAPRSDVLVLDDKMIALDPPGFFDSLLILAAAHATDECNSGWHESNIAAEVKRTWTHPDELLNNIPWVSDPDRLRKQVPTERHHGGEFDAAVIKVGILFDFQAKSARSVDYQSRERLPASEALRQHKELQTAGASGIWTVQSGANKSDADTLRSDQPLIIGPGGLIHIPISVGTEEVHGWGVGASLFDAAAFPRVMTTLDHLRLVNDYVPPHFREVYWIDRYSQEFGQVRFVNEMDYLEKWHSILRSEGGVFKVVGPNQLALASDGPIESDVLMRNMEHGSDMEAGSVPSPAGVHLRETGPDRNAPKLNRILRSLIDGNVPGAIGLVRSVLGSNMVAAEKAVANKRDVLLNSSVGDWGLVHKAPGRPDFGFSGADVVLYTDLRWGAWRIWERTPWQAQLWNESTAPLKIRFTAGQRRE